MKRDIACHICEASYQDHPQGIYSLGETVRKVYGTALQNFRCDACGESIPIGTKCVAVSVILDGQRYFKWEGEFVEPVSKKDWDISKAVARGMTGQRTAHGKGKRQPFWEPKLIKRLVNRILARFGYHLQRFPRPYTKRKKQGELFKEPPNAM